MPDAVDSTPTRKLGGFEVLREIGQGGMGVIYLARQPSLDRFVVLKQIRRELLSDETMVRRFRMEAQAAASVQHQNVVAVYDCFAHRGHYFIAQELVAGLDLRTVLGRVERIAPPIAEIVALEVARGLEEIHLQGIVHRDVKPANILIGYGGETKITDFGIALGDRSGALTRPGTLLGSVPYMSPEQMQGWRVDPRSDLFSFGVLLYEMLTGAPPFSADSDDDSLEPLLEAIESQSYEPARSRVPDVRRYLDRLIRCCLEPDPGRRPAAATEVRQTLERRLAWISPSECRRRIASYFQDCGVLPAPPASDTTRARPVAQATRGKENVRLGRALAVLLLVIPLAAWVVIARWKPGDAEPSLTAPLSLSRLSPGATAATAVADRDRPPDTVVDASEDLPPTADTSASPVGRPSLLASLPVAEADSAPVAPAPEAAHVRFAAFPWAEVVLEDGRRFHTPREEPLDLAPGTYHVVFEHPRFGHAEYKIELEAGEQVTLRHVFEEARQ